MIHFGMTSSSPFPSLQIYLPDRFNEGMNQWLPDFTEEEELKLNIGMSP